MAQQPQIMVYQIRVPQHTVWEGKRAHQFIEQLLSNLCPLYFQITATAQSIQWQIIDPLGRSSSALETAIRASYSEATIQALPLEDVMLPQTYPLSRVVLKYQQQVETFLAPIVHAPDIKTPDPLAMLVECMDGLQVGESISYHLFIEGSAHDAYERGQKQLTMDIRDGSLLSLVRPYKVDRYTAELTRVLMAKLGQRLYQASLFIQIDTPDPSRIGTLVMIDNLMVGFDQPGFGALLWIDDQQGVLTITDNESEWQTSAAIQYLNLREQPDTWRHKNKLKQQMSLILEPREIASLWHLPHDGFTTATINWAYSHVRLPVALRGKHEGVCLGVNVTGGRREPIYIPDRTGHMSLVGKSGMGKTNLFHHLIHQDILAGRGVCVIDPHGALVSDILRYSIPRNREQDVVILDLADEAYPIPLNLLTVPPGVDRSVGAGQLLGVLDHLYELGSTPTVADSLFAALITLMHDDTPTIRDVGRLFQDDTYRTSLLSKLSNVAALEYWDRFKAKDQAINSVLWRLRGLYGNETLYPILCHPDALRFNTLIAQKKIILVSLKADESRIPAREQSLLGLVLLSQLQQSIMARPPQSEPFYVFVDEVQHFVTTTFDTLLSEARKYGLALTTANQYLRQIAGDTLDAIFGNVGTMVMFQTGLDDAKRLAPYVSPQFDDQQLMQLGQYEAAVVTRYHEQTLPVFSMKTLPPLRGNGSHQDAQDREAFLRQLSRTRYTPKSRAEVMAWLAQKYPRPDQGTSSPNANTIVDME